MPGSTLSYANRMADTSGKVEFSLRVWGMVGGGSGEGEVRTGPALNPLKGSSARLPPMQEWGSTSQTKANCLRNIALPAQRAGKNALYGQKIRRLELF